MTFVERSTIRTFGSICTSSEALPQLDNRFTKERRILIVDWSNVRSSNEPIKITLLSNRCYISAFLF